MMGQRVLVLCEAYWTLSVVLRRKEADFCCTKGVPQQLNCLRVERPFPWGNVVPGQLAWTHIQMAWHTRRSQQVGCAEHIQAGVLPVHEGSVISDRPGDLCRKPPTCCPCGQGHGSPLDGEERTARRSQPPSSLDSLCASSFLGLTTGQKSVCPCRGRPSPNWRRLSKPLSVSRLPPGLHLSDTSRPPHRAPEL